METENNQRAVEIISYVEKVSSASLFNTELLDTFLIAIYGYLEYFVLD